LSISRRKPLSASAMVELLPQDFVGCLHIVAPDPHGAG
jgi:hypothetical protein